ncbi:NAD-dependent aldehyde dehydrogenase [Corynebacterium mustelae]|uniref:NAD-dependent aldehyde dehydrogenase n=1 Tax=Corynebacterium mustelae TaxID=571915 RepID=A0A0G3GU74_9CORY|nr:succinic semialdehyde dehydrogenase [Corynebacterium mustelae]AKK04664.1 NAD-dependent aldehyde dehydrogenase [Corynebacterium mustelae]
MSTTHQTDNRSDLIEVINPRTGEVIDTVISHSEAETQEAFDRARRAQRTWAKRSVAERAKIIMRMHDVVLANQAEILDTIQLETGKNRASAFDEVLDVAINARYYAKKAPKLLRPQHVKGALPVLTKTIVQHAPKGVVGIISPWNYPLTLTLSDAIPALIAGNAVVLKPDSQTPLTALAGAQIAREAGLPEDLYQVITGPGAVVGETIANHADFLMFTGSTETGRKLGAIAGERLIGFSAELGGKNPMIITADANIDVAVRTTIAGCFSNTGQLCISIERIYVHEDVAAQYVDKLVAAVENLTIGGGGWEENIGSMISATQADNVMALVDDAVAQGAKKLTGGRRPDLGSAFIAPIVLVDVPEAARLYREEVFGPVVYIETFSSEAEVIERANDSEYGLNAAVCAGHNRWQIAAQLEVGTVNINEGFAAAFGSIDAPMGGWKASGTGRRHSDAGLLKYTEPRTIAEQRVLPISGPKNLPRETYAAVMTNLLRLGKRFL